MTEKFIKRHCLQCENYTTHSFWGKPLKDEDSCDEIDEEGGFTHGRLTELKQCPKGWKK